MDQQVYRWEYYNTRTGRWFDCRDRAVVDDGRLCDWKLLQT